MSDSTHHKRPHGVVELTHHIQLVPGRLFPQNVEEHLFSFGLRIVNCLVLCGLFGDDICLIVSIMVLELQLMPGDALILHCCVTRKAPRQISVAPTAAFHDNASLRNIAAKTTVMARLSLSMDATCDAVPDFSAAK